MAVINTPTRCELAFAGICEGEAETTVRVDEDLPACQSCAQRFAALYRPQCRSDWEVGE